MNKESCSWINFTIRIYIYNFQPEIYFSSFDYISKSGIEDTVQYHDRSRADVSPYSPVLSYPTFYPPHHRKNGDEEGNWCRGKNQ